MASGSFDLTTYYAKRIMGDNNASTAATALLQSGVDNSMWIFGHARGNYGIKYLKANSGTADKIEFHGGATDTTTAWVELDDGAASFGETTLSSASITNNATIGGTLGVTGATTLNGNTTHGGHVYLTGTTSTGENNTTQIVFTNSGATTEYLALTANTSGSFIINPSSSSSTGQVVFVPSGNSYLKSGTLTVNASGQSDYTFKVSGTANITGVTTLSSTTAIDTSNYTTGALVVSGGASFNKDIIVNGWLRTGGEKGWYNQTYAGGLYMRDSSYVRMYGNKQFVISSSHSTSANNLSSQLIVSSIAYNSAIDTTAGNAVAIELWRGSNASWQIVNDGGVLHFKNNWTTAKQSTYTQDSITIAYNTGNTTIAGTLITGGSIYAGPADSTAERSVVARSNAGSISIYSTGNNDSNGARGLYFSAHGTGAAVTAVHCDTNNNITLRLMESTNNKYVAVKADANTDNRTWTIPVTAGNRYFMGTTASSYTVNQMFYAPAATYIGQTPGLYYIPEADAELGTTKGKKVGILLVGTAYGNTAANLGSNTVNVFRFGDPGPQIRFSTATNGAEMGAIIWSSHSTSNNLDQAFYFVGRTDTNNTEANVGIVTKTIVARTRLTVGQNYCNTDWALYVSGGICSTSTQYIKNTTMDLTAANNGSSNTLYTAYEGCDKNGKNYFSVEGYSSSDGSTTTGLYIRNYATDGTDQGWSALTITKTKTNAVTTSIPGTVTIINTTNATYSDSSSPALLVNGGARIKKNLFAGLSTDTEERQVGVVSKAGKIYLYSEGSTTGNRGIYGYNAAGTGANILTLNQNSRITGLVGIKTDFTFYQGDTVIRGGIAPSSNAYRALVFRSADVNNERKMLAQIANIYRTSGENELELVVVAPRSDATDTQNGLRIYSGTTTSNNTTTDYAYGTFSAPLAVNTTTGNHNYALYANGAIYSKSLTLSGTTTNDMDAGSSNPNIKFVENDSTQPVYIIYTDQDSYRAPAGLKIIGGTSATPAWFEVEGSIYAGSSTHTAERDIYAMSNSGTIALYSIGNSNSNGNRGLWFGAHGNGSSLTAVSCDTNTNVTLCARTAGAGITIAARSTPWPHIRFDTTASESGAAYTTVTQTTQGMIYCQVPAKKESDSTYYRTRFFFRQYSTTNNTTTRLEGFEDYYLPTTNAGLTTSKTYDILTTKDLSFSITGSSASVSYTVPEATWDSSKTSGAGSYSRNLAWMGSAPSGSGTFRLQNELTATGTSIGRFQVRTYTGSAWGDYGGISITANRDNTFSYAVSNIANFRSAIGVGASGTHEDSYFALASHTHISLWQRTSLTKGTNPSSTNYMLGSWAMETGSGTAIANRLHGFEGYVDTNGRSGIRFITYQYTSGGTTVNQLGCYIDKNGTRGYTITDVAAFRNTLNLGTAATTDSTAYISSTMSSNTSNKFAGCNANFRKYGNMVFLTIQGDNATALAAGTSAFTIPSGYRPAEAHWYPMVRAGSLAMLGIYTDGKIVCSVAITAGNTIRADAIYIADS